MEFSQNHLICFLNNLQKSGNKQSCRELVPKENFDCTVWSQCLGRCGSRTQDLKENIQGQDHGHHGSHPCHRRQQKSLNVTLVSCGRSQILPHGVFVRSHHYVKRFLFFKRWGGKGTKGIRIDRRSPPAMITYIADITARDWKPISHDKQPGEIEAWTRIFPAFQGIFLLPFLKSKGFSWYSLIGEKISRWRGKFISSPRDLFYIMPKCLDFKDIYEVD